MFRRTVAPASFALAAIAFSVPLHAQPAPEDAIVVTANRFPQSDPAIPANVTVVTREQIRGTPATSLLDVLKNQLGVQITPLYGALGIDATLDLRGFGDTAASNTLILLDGQRLNPVSSDSINWSVIPLENVQRIEIIRGSGAVLFGDRASGGVVNIITDKSAKPRASAGATLGDYGYRGADAFVGGGQDGPGYFTLSGHYAATNGYRQNSEQDEQSVAGRVGLRGGFGEGFVDYSLYKSSNGLPSSLSKAQFDSNPRQARTPNDFQRRDGYRIRPGVSAALGENLALEAELGFDEDRGHSHFVGAFGTSDLDRTRDTTSLTPRLRWRHDLGALRSETVFGADLYRGTVDGRTFSSSGDNRQTARQDSGAFYAQNVTDLTPVLHLTTGARRQRVQQHVTDESAALTADTTRAQSAYDVGLTYDVARGSRIYGKVGRTFRFANTDELFGFDPITFVTTFRGDLLPQHGVIRELGGSTRQGALAVQVTVYQLDLKDEIGFDSTIQSNVNFQATRRRGLELEGRWDFSSRLTTKLGLAYTEAKFTEGSFIGKTVPMVPRAKANAGLDWKAGAAGTYSVRLNYVGPRYFSGDFANALPKLSGYSTADAQAAWDLRPWTLAVRLMNVFNQKYAASGILDFTGAPFYYPADPRTIFLSARYDFK